ncbi:MAG: heme-dependent oxidative N-demethylase family protein [Saccharospirillum sp.]
MASYAFEQHAALLSMGLNKLNLRDWVLPDQNLAKESALKQQLWREQGERVFSSLPESAAAQREVATLLQTHLTERFPQWYEPITEGLHCSVTNQTHQWRDAVDPLLPASWCVQEDLCLLQEVEGDYRLTAASLCAPSYWRLLDKIGQPLDAIHRPVPGFAETLGAKVNRFFQFIKVERPVWRANWSVVTSDRLYQPGDEESIIIDDPAGIEQQCWLRTERQTLRRLPGTGAVLFTIKVSLKPLAELRKTPAVLSSLARAVAQLSEAERRYKSLHHLEPALSQWLLCTVEEATDDQHAANGVEQ